MALSGKDFKGIAILGALVAGAIIVLFTWPAGEKLFKSFAKAGSTETELSLLEEQKLKLDYDLKFYRDKLSETLVVSLHEYPSEHLEEHIKVLVDRLVRLAVGSGNQLISLKPYDAVQPAIEVEAPPEKTSSKRGRPKKEDVPETVMKPLPVNAYGYDIDIRGSYDEVLDFLAKVEREEEILEMRSFTLTNEAGPEREDFSEDGSNANLDPTKPIKLNGKFRLLMVAERS